VTWKISYRTKASVGVDAGGMPPPISWLPNSRRWETIGTQHDERWRKSGEGFLKVNIDEPLCKTRVGAVGAAVHGSSGHLQGSSARHLSSVGLALLAEAEALREGVRLIFGGHCFKGFSLEEQGFTSLGNCDNSERGGRVAGSFTSFRLVYTRGPAIHAAHLCAQHCLASFRDFVWQSFPSFLQNCL